MINKERLLKNYISLTCIEGVSKIEKVVMEEVINRLEELGIDYEFDKANRKTGGNCGNLIAHIKGNFEKGSPFFFSAHVDTIMSSACTPVIKDGVIYSDGNVVLGADDRAGVAAMLEAVETAIENGLSYPDIDLLFLVCEEIGLLGSKYLDFSKVNGKYGFVIDSSADVGKVIYKAPTHYSCEITIKGKAAHAAIAPELGVHTIKIAADAISKTEVGRVTGDTTVSIGTIQGGIKTNVIPEQTDIKGEIRSLNVDEIPVFRKKLENTFKKSAEEYGGKCSFEWKKEYIGFSLEEDSEIIKWITKSMENAGIKPELIPFIGGSDANNYNEKGIPAINLGLGYKKNHSSEEYLKVDDLTGITNVCYEIIRQSTKM